jgi:hypothetical protein
MVLLRVKEPEQLKLIKKGGQVAGVYAETVAITVVAAPAKQKEQAIHSHACKANWQFLIDAPIRAA